MMGDSLVLRMGVLIGLSVLIVGSFLVVPVLIDDSLLRWLVISIIIGTWITGMKLVLFRLLSSNHIKLAILNGYVILVGLTTGGKGWIVTLVSEVPYINELVVEYGNISPYVIGAIFILYTILAFVLIKSFRPINPMGEPKQNISDILPTSDQKNSLKALYSQMSLYLRRIDVSSQWNDGKFIALDADIHVLTKTGMRQTKGDLLAALKSNSKSNLFLLLGDPGSGKSVALRKLASEMLLLDFEKYNKIPVYINLKEWKTKDKWTPENLPTIQQFDQFVQTSMKQILEFSSMKFLDSHFDSFKAAGSFFFLFDSFDEIPAVMGVSENSWLIRELSEIIIQYTDSVNGGKTVISSRYFRRPSLELVTHTTLEIRPFSEKKVIQCVKVLAVDASEEIISQILSGSGNYEALSKNPFLLGLLVDYYNVEKKLPASQYELFKSYFEKNLDYAIEQELIMDSERDELFMQAVKIAKVMFDYGVEGLEISIHKLRELMGDVDVDKVIYYLLKAKIGRGTEASTFTFSHRRFSEFLIVNTFINEPESAHIEAIYENSGWRDAMVLYGEVANDEIANQLLAVAWGRAKDLKQLSALSGERSFEVAYNALRYILEVYRGRLELLKPYENELYNLVVHKLLDPHADEIDRYIACEALAVVPVARSKRPIFFALEVFDDLVIEGAVRALRYLPSIHDPIALSYFKHLTRDDGFPSLVTIKSRLELLSYSNSFSLVEKYMKSYQWNSAPKVLALAISAILFPLQLLLGITVYWSLPLVKRALDLAFIDISLAMQKITERREKAKDDKVGSLAVEIDPSDPIKLRDRFHSQFLKSSASIQASRLYIAAFFAAQTFSSKMFGRTGDSLFDQSYAASPAIGLFLLLIIINPFKKSVKLFSQNYIYSAFLNIFRIETLYVLAAVLIMVVIIVLVGTFMEWIYGIFPMIIVPVLAMLTIGYLSVSFYYYKRYIVDRRIYKKVTKEFNASRKVIGVNFSSFQSEHFKKLYVSWLRNNYFNHVDELRLPENAWPDNIRPRSFRSQAAKELTILDMQWYGVSSKYL